ncbi:MAG: hypothetical protein RLZZ524_1188 [Pseudomonadota bacterium]
MFSPHHPLAPDRLPDGDVAWLGVNERLAPPLLPEGVASFARNLRFREQRAEPRRGIGLCWWGRFDGSGAFDNVYGGGVVADPSTGVESILVAAEDIVWLTRPQNRAVEVPLNGHTLTSFSGFVQGRGVVYLLRGDDQAPLICRDLANGFEALPDPAPGFVAAPNARAGIYYLNRFMLVAGRDYLWVSDAPPGEGQFALDSIYQPNQGDPDALVAVAAWNLDTLVALKERRVYLYLNASAGASSAQFRNGSLNYGCIAPKSVVVAGSELFWLSAAGVANMRLTALNQEQGTTLLLSDDLPATFRRVNWLAAHQARFEVSGSYLYCALPLDGSTVCNAVAVYDLKHQLWAGVDESAVLSTGLLDWLQFGWQGRTRLGFIGGDGYIHIYEDGFEDELWDGEKVVRVDIATDLITRGYTLRQEQRKRYRQARVLMSTWDPEYALSVIREGVAEETTVAPTRTRNRAASRRYGAAAYDATNADDAHDDAGRMDYSLLLDGPLDEVVPPDGQRGPAAPGSHGVYIGSGITPDLHQDSTDTVALAGDGHWLQLRITNTQGRAVVRGVLLEAEDALPPVAVTS